MFKNIRRTVIAAAAAFSLGIGGAVWATSAASAAPAAVSACSTANLAVWVDLSQASAAAGTVAYPLDFTNTGSHACTLDGYPGVSARYGSSGKQLGRAADRNPEFKAKTVTIPAGGSAHAYLFWANVVNFTASQCKPATASVLQVYPPNRKSAAFAFFSLQGCQNTKPLFQYLFVTAVLPGVGHVI
jgi:hypothetical protein